MPTFYSRSTGETWELEPEDFTKPCKEAPFESASIECDKARKTRSANYNPSSLLDCGPKFPFLKITEKEHDLGFQSKYSADFNHCERAVIFPLSEQEDPEEAREALDGVMLL
jgi:hypothetical protein